MTHEAFEELVTSLEKRYRDRHGALERRAVMLAFVGYCGLAFFLLSGVFLMLACGGLAVLHPGFVTIKLGLFLGIPAAIFSWSVVRALWVRLHPPEGVRVTAGQAPALFGLIAEIGARAGGVRFDQVLLTHDLNAAVVQVPRLGVFGWYRTYLILGVPLMDALSPEEFKSVLAHEFAHLSHQHGRLAGWVYRLRASWLGVMDRLSSGSGLFRPVVAFIEWFWPRFNASAFVLSRSQEYQADAFAASVTSPQSSGLALQRLEVESRRLGSSFWSGIGESMRDEPAPPEDVFHRMSRFLGTPPEAPLVGRWLSQAMAMKTDTSDTHPALKDRLAALGVAPAGEAGLQTPAQKASEAWLGEAHLREVREGFSREWRQEAKENWNVGYLEKQELKRRLEALPEGASGREWERLLVKCRLFGPRAVEGELRSFLEAHPAHPLASLMLGSHLAEEDDPAAIPLLETAARRPDLLRNALGAMADFYRGRGQEDEIRTLRRRFEQHDGTFQMALAERNSIQAGDRLKTPELTAAERASVAEAVKRHEEVTGAWIAGREMRWFPEWRAFVVAIEIRWPAHYVPSADSAQRVLQRILDAIEIDAYLLAIARDSKNRAIVAKIAAVEGAAIGAPGA